jgi:predicted DsbA family dithiol-disulfide isomerase
MFGIKKVDDMVSRARKINQVLDELGITPTSQTGKEIRGAIALELLGEEHPVMEKYSKAVFLKSVDNDDMKRLLDLLREEGLLNKKGAKLLESQQDKK